MRLQLVQLHGVCVGVCAVKLLSCSTKCESLVQWQRFGARTERMIFSCHVTYRVGLSASSVSFFTGQKMWDDLYRALSKLKRDLSELSGRVCAGCQVNVYNRLCAHASLVLPQWKAPIGSPYMSRSIESTE